MFHLFHFAVFAILLPVCAAVSLLAKFRSLNRFDSTLKKIGRIPLLGMAELQDVHHMKGVLNSENQYGQLLVKKHL
jgi:hypothetical protein